MMNHNFNNCEKITYEIVFSPSKIQNLPISHTYGWRGRIGFIVQVVASTKLDLETHYQVGNQPPETAYRMLKSLDRKDSDAVVINNPNIRTLEIIEPIEQDIGKPVITGNLATMRACLRAIGIKDQTKCGGRPFQT